MTPAETSAAWERSFQKHFARMMGETTHRNPSPQIEELVRDLAKKAADAEMAVLAQPARWH